MKLVVGNINGGNVNNHFFGSILALYQHLRDQPDVLSDILVLRTGPVLSGGRGRLVNLFLEETDGDAFLMLDSDMAFTPGMVVSMVDAFEKVREANPTVGMLGGLAFTEGGQREVKASPTIWVDHPVIPGAYVKVDHYPPDTLLEVSGTGMACVLIGRDCLEAVTKNGVNPFHHISLVNWPMLARAVQACDTVDQIEQTMRSAVLDADQLAEDLSFCRRVKDAGWRILLHTGLRFDHAKTVLIGEPEYLSRLPGGASPQEGT